MESNSNNNILIGAILGSLAVVGIIAGTYIIHKKGGLDKFSQEYLAWPKFKSYEKMK